VFADDVQEVISMYGCIFFLMFVITPTTGGCDVSAQHYFATQSKIYIYL
jgi:hypothetical protein